jgi:hypothetical protein
MSIKSLYILNAQLWNLKYQHRIKFLFLNKLSKHKSMLQHLNWGTLQTLIPAVIPEESRAKKLGQFMLPTYQPSSPLFMILINYAVPNPYYQSQWPHSLRHKLSSHAQMLGP